jgi:large subunit ribosomal protein L32
MAVPKKKTSKSRRDKRRGGHTHEVRSASVNVCPQCGQPKRPHRVCPTCKTYRGRDVEPLRVDTP